MRDLGGMSIGRYALVTRVGVGSDVNVAESERNSLGDNVCMFLIDKMPSEIA